MKANELFEKFVAFLFDNGIALTQFHKEKKDLSPGKRKHLIKKFLDSKIMTECEYCDEGYCTEIVYDTFNEPQHRRRMQKRCIVCNGTGKKTASIRSRINILDK